MNINEEIKKLSETTLSTQAMIVYSESGGAALMMPVKDLAEGKRYRVWNDLLSIHEAVDLASAFGNESSKVDFSFKKISEVPEDSELLLCALFLKSFCR